MKILLTTLNSKYIHTALSLRYLKSYCQDTFENLEIQEYTINHQIDYVLGEIHKGKFEVVCFSCYIWNMNQTGSSGVGTDSMSFRFRSRG